MIDELAQELWAWIVEEIVSHGLRHLIWLVLIAILGALFVRKSRSRIQYRQMVVGSHNIQININALIQQEAKHPPDGGMMYKSGSVVETREAQEPGTAQFRIRSLVGTGYHDNKTDTAYLGTRFGTFSIRLSGKVETITDVVRWLHRQRLMAPLEHDGASAEDRDR